MYLGRNALKILLADSSFAKGAFWVVRFPYAVRI